MITYRLANIQDVKILVEQRLQFLEVNTNQNNFFEIFSNTKECIEHMMQGKHMDAVVALDGDKVIGVGMIYFFEGLPTLYNMKGFTGKVENLYVQMKYRSNGIGRKILEMLIESAKKRGVEAIFVNSSDAGQNLLLETGFIGIHNMMICQL